MPPAEDPDTPGSATRRLIAEQATTTVASIEPSPPPAATIIVMTVRELYELEDEQELLLGTDTNLSPTWSPERQSEYIKELFSNTAAACFTLAEETLYDLSVSILIDGFQRLHAIVNFFMGAVPYLGEDGAVWYPLATPQWREIFDHTPIIIRSFSAIDGQATVWRATFRPSF